MEFVIEESKINPSELVVFEGLLDGLTLPADYIEHMLQFNGGFPKGEVGFLFDDEMIELEYFHPIKYGDPILEEKLAMRELLPDAHISIGRVIGGGISMSLGSRDYGAIYLYDEDLLPEKVANSFSGFIKGLVKIEE